MRQRMAKRERAVGSARPAGWRRVASWAGAVLLATSLAPGVARAADDHRAVLSAPPAASPWQLEQRDDDPVSGFRIYRREVPDSDFEAFRLEAVIDAPPHVVAEAFRKNIVDPEVSQARTTKTVLRNDEVVIVYSYIDMPLVSDRDVISRCERDPDPQDGSIRYRWFVTDEGPAPTEGVVRLEKSDGSWEFRPLPPDGPGGERTFAVNEIHTEIGGAIPAWLVNRLILETVMDGISDLRARVDRDHRYVSAGPPEAASKSR
jgi:hypothetical protein